MLQVTRICNNCGAGGLFWRTIRPSPFTNPIAVSSRNVPIQQRLTSFRAASTTSSPENPLPPTVKPEDAPVRYSTSKAYVHKVLNFDEKDERPKYQRAIISISLAIFMLYFFVFREENDLDREMKRPLWEKVPGLEKQTLIALIEYNKKQKKSTAVAEARLKEILAEEEIVQNSLPILKEKTPSIPVIIPAKTMT